MTLLIKNHGSLAQWFESELSLTSEHACREVTGCAQAAKRLACVVPEVNLWECTLHSPLQKANKAEPTLALNPRGDVTRNPKQGYQWSSLCCQL